MNNLAPDNKANSKAIAADHAAANEEHLSNGETFLILAALSAIALSLLSFSSL